jgi:hypothetical protein
LQEDVACSSCHSASALDGALTYWFQIFAGNLGATVNGVNVYDLSVSELKEAAKCYSCMNPKLLLGAYYNGLIIVIEQLLQERVAET